jgi:hypothetical protein
MAPLRRHSSPIPSEVENALKVLDEHHKAFVASRPFADATGHPVPSDTRAWSQILVSTLTGISGLKRKKGADLSDGSDVKAANVWSAIDTPRFNNCIPAGRTSEKSKRPSDISALDDTPYIFFVLWDEMGEDRVPRCRVWCVRPAKDRVFRNVCAKWYSQYAAGEVSDNFQLHPPRNQDHNGIRNTCGNMQFPLLFCATRKSDHFELLDFDRDVLTRGTCRLLSD